jgi:hypothetical protein
MPKNEILVYVDEENQTLLSNVSLKFFWSDCSFSPENYETIEDLKHFTELTDSELTEKNAIEKIISSEKEYYLNEYEEYQLRKNIQEKENIISDMIVKLKQRLKGCTGCEKAYINENKLYCIKHNKIISEVVCCSTG